MIQFRNKVKKWMINNSSNYKDILTGELNCTSLAEEAANEFDLYSEESTFEVPDELFAWAVEVKQQLDKS
jgi:hypothetical protein